MKKLNYLFLSLPMAFLLSVPANADIQIIRPPCLDDMLKQCFNTYVAQSALCALTDPFGNECQTNADNAYDRCLDRAYTQCPIRLVFIHDESTMGVE